MNKVHFSSAKHDYETPDDFFRYWNWIFNFTVDVCANENNAKCSKFYCESDWNSPEESLDQQAWAVFHPSSVARCWMNPPYGREIGKWVAKAYEESQKGCLVVCLLPARTDTKWWHEYCTRGTIKFIKGRLSFKGAPSTAPFPSAIVIFWPAGMEMV